MQSRLNYNAGIQISAVYGCNLNCPHCFHGSNYDRGIVVVSDYVHWCECWVKRLKPRGVHIMGGEVTLHPDLPTIVNETKRIWHDSPIYMSTNGSLPHRFTPELLQSLKGVGIEISVKDYPNILGKDLLPKINDTIRILKANGNAIYIRNHGYITWIDNVNWLPPDNTAEDAFKNCLCGCHFPISKTGVLAIDNNKLYRCVTMWAMHRLYKNGKIHWEGLMDYTPLNPDCSAEDLIGQIIEGRRKPCEQCRFCPGTRKRLYNSVKEFKSGFEKLC